MVENKTSISGGEYIRAILLDNAEVAAITTKVFPLVYPAAELHFPYIAYQRTSLAASATKQVNADTVTMAVGCFAKDYEGSVRLAEAVRSALDYAYGTIDTLPGLQLASCTLSNATEAYDTASDAYVQNLQFTLKLRKI